MRRAKAKKRTKVDFVQPVCFLVQNGFLVQSRLRVERLRVERECRELGAKPPIGEGDVSSPVLRVSVLLARWRAVTEARSNLKAFPGHLQFDLVVFAVTLVVCGVVSDQILIPQLLGYCRER